MKVSSRPSSKLLAAASQSRSVHTVFAAIAALLAAIGLYGVIAHSVTHRTQEIGIRMALGARSGQVLRLVVLQALALVAIGVVIGFAGALALGRLLETQLFGVRPTDPPTLAAVAALLGLIGLISCFIPACRAARVEPLVALRQD